MIKRSVLYLLAICILSVIHKLRKYVVWVPSDPSQPPSLPRATDFPGLMWTGKPVGRKTPPSEELRLCSFFSSASLERPFFKAAADGAIGARPLRCELAAWEAAVSLFHNEESDLLATTNQTQCKRLLSVPSFALAEGGLFALFLQQRPVLINRWQLHL